MRYAGNDIVAGERPFRSHATVFNPYIAVAVGESHLYIGVLHEHRGMRLQRMVHYLALVVHEVLYGKRGRYYFMARAEMIELATRQRQHSHGELRQFGVVDDGVSAQTAPEFGIQVVVLHRAVGVHRFLHEQPYRPVGQQPDADVGEVEMRIEEFAELLHRRFLEHALHHAGCLAARHEHAVVFGYLCAEPQPVAHHVGIGHRAEGLGGTDIHVAAHYHRVQAFRRSIHYALVERNLEREEVLRQPLSPLPPEHRHGGEDFPRRGIGRQPAALSAGMKHEAFLRGEPFAERSTGTVLPRETVAILHIRFKSPLQQPRGTAPGTKFHAHRVVGAEPLFPVKPGHVMKAVHQVWRQRQ